MEFEILEARSGKKVCSVRDVNRDSTVAEVKRKIAAERKKYSDIHRQELRLQAKGKFLKDEETLQGLEEGQHTLYFKDRGLQIGWITVFLSEYAGPLFVYLLIYARPWLLYGDVTTKHSNRHHVVNLAAACWTLHYAKRLLETLFVHRFSNATMPIANLFKNCSYYWGFAAFVSYHVNHPLFTPPGDTQVYAALVGFIFCELGNLSIHVALRNLRPPGTKVRKIPVPTANPFTILFDLVSCPNYTYEIGAWISFAVMTQCIPAALFCLAGAYPMTIWAAGKHRNYKREFADYPKGRMAIIPFVK